MCLKLFKWIKYFLNGKNCRLPIKLIYSFDFLPLTKLSYNFEQQFIGFLNNFASSNKFCGRKQFILIKRFSPICLSILIFVFFFYHSKHGLHVKDFDVSWQNGEAFTALVHHFIPALVSIDSQPTASSSSAGNTSIDKIALMFEFARLHLNIWLVFSFRSLFLISKFLL